MYIVSDGGQVKTDTLYIYTLPYMYKKKHIRVYSAIYCRRIRKLSIVPVGNIFCVCEKMNK